MNLTPNVWQRSASGLRTRSGSSWGRKGPIRPTCLGPCGYQNHESSLCKRGFRVACSATFRALLAGLLLFHLTDSWVNRSICLLTRNYSRTGSSKARSSSRLPWGVNNSGVPPAFASPLPRGRHHVIECSFITSAATHRWSTNRPFSKKVQTSLWTRDV
jgi:hypothetical protein